MRYTTDAELCKPAVQGQQCHGSESTCPFTSYCWAVTADKHFYAVLCEAAITSLVPQALQGVHERQVAWLDGLTLQ